MKITVKNIKTGYGKAKGLSVEWNNGQYCAIITPKGQIGCGIYDIRVMKGFGMVGAIARGIPKKPLKRPEDLLKSKIIGLTPSASRLGIRKGMTGMQALKILLKTKNL